MNTKQVNANRLKTFLDVRDVVGCRNVRWHTFLAVKRPEPVIGPEPLYASTGYCNTLADGDRIRMWYQPRSKEELIANPTLVAYAESTDGLHWETPELGLRELARSLRNNLTELSVHCPSIIRNPDTTDAQKAWLAVGNLNSPWGFFTAHSPDGLRWQLDGGEPIFPLGDVGTFIYDEYRGQFFGTPKIDMPVRLFSRRNIAVSTSDDFYRWTNPRLVLVPDEMDDQIAHVRGFHHCDFYGMGVLPLPDLLVGFLWVFWIREPLEPGTGKFGFHRYGHGIFGSVDVQLTYSYDGLYWHRAPGRQSVMENGPTGTFDASGIYTSFRPLLRNGNLLVYYDGESMEHGFQIDQCWQPRGGTVWKDEFTPGGIGLATFPHLRLAGFSSLEDGTVDVRLPGNDVSDCLWINARCPNGHVKAEVLDRDTMQPVAGLSLENSIPFTGDEGYAELQWKDASITNAPRDRYLIARFTLRNADLFAYGLKHG